MTENASTRAHPKAKVDQEDLLLHGHADAANHTVDLSTHPFDTGFSNVGFRGTHLDAVEGVSRALSHMGLTHGTLDVLGLVVRHHLESVEVFPRQA